MKIRIAVIPPEDLVRVRPVVDSLRTASDNGDMDGVDSATKKLLSLSESEQSIDLTEKEWREWLSEIRETNPTFQSEYLISGDFCINYFREATSDTVVLQLPIEEHEGDNV